jgi:hypothetical protein
MEIDRLMHTQGEPDDDWRAAEAQLLLTLERLLQLDATSVPEALNAATQLVSEALGADKVDAFLYHSENQTLQVAGLSDRPMSKQQVAIGMDRMALAEGGRLVEVFHTGKVYETGHADQDPEVARGFSEGLGVRSILATTLQVGESAVGSCKRLPPGKTRSPRKTGPSLRPWPSGWVSRSIERSWWSSISRRRRKRGGGRPPKTWSPC